jgi:hypothetical protein
MTPKRYLELQFIKGIRKGYLTNAELCPQGTDAPLPYMSSEEHCIVTVHDKPYRATSHQPKQHLGRNVDVRLYCGGRFSHILSCEQRTAMPIPSNYRELSPNSWPQAFRGFT